MEKSEEKIDMVIRDVNCLCRMSCIDPKVYAMEGGWAYAVAEHVHESMNFNQLRKFFNSVKSIKRDLKTESDKNIDEIQEEVRTHMYGLFPELAYALGRKLVTEKFYKLMKLCLAEKVTSVRDFLVFEKFLSAILAYCKMCELIDKRKREGGE